MEFLWSIAIIVLDIHIYYLNVYCTSQIAVKFYFLFVIVIYYSLRDSQAKLWAFLIIGLQIKPLWFKLKSFCLTIVEFFFIIVWNLQFCAWSFIYSFLIYEVIFIDILILPITTGNLYWMQYSKFVILFTYAHTL